MFHSNLTVPFHGTRLMSEDDMTAYLETQVISAPWETILLMVPATDWLYDLITMRQQNLGVSRVPPTCPLSPCCRLRFVI